MRRLNVKCQILILIQFNRRKNSSTEIYSFYLPSRTKGPHKIEIIRQSSKTNISKQELPYFCFETSPEILLYSLFGKIQTNRWLVKRDRSHIHLL